MWNDCRNAIRRGAKQYTLLLSLTMNNMSHGPFKSGRNAQTLSEGAESLAEQMSEESFDELVESMCVDMQCEPDDDRIPQSPSMIPGLPLFQKLPVFAARLKLTLLLRFLLTQVSCNRVSSLILIITLCLCLLLFSNNNVDARSHLGQNQELVCQYRSHGPLVQQLVSHVNDPWPHPECGPRSLKKLISFLIRFHWHYNYKWLSFFFYKYI